MTQRFQGWVPPAPVSEAIRETSIIQINHLSFDGGNGTLITNAYFDHYLYPETLPERISVAGFGEHRPIEINTNPESMRKNRRIEIKLTQP